MDTMANRDKRQVGMGFIGRLMQRRLKSNIMTKDVKKQLDNLDDHRLDYKVFMNVYML